MNSNGAWALIAGIGLKKAIAQFNKEQARSFEKYEQVEVYRMYAIKRCDTKYISAMLKEVRLVENERNGTLARFRESFEMRNTWVMHFSEDNYNRLY